MILWVPSSPVSIPECCHMLQLWQTALHIHAAPLTAGFLHSLFPLVRVLFHLLPHLSKLLCKLEDSAPLFLTFQWPSLTSASQTPENLVLHLI